jgi:hypothetical protein
LGFGEATPAQNAQYVQIIGRPELYLLPRDVGEEWQLAHDMAGRADSLLLPVSIAQVWAAEILSGGMLYRFERDPARLWFHHVGQHVHALRADGVRSGDEDQDRFGYRARCDGFLAAVTWPGSRSSAGY